MNKIWHWVQQHPWLSGLFVFGVGILLILMRRGGSSQAVAASGETPAQLAANTQLAAAQIQGTTALGLANINAGVQSQAISAGQNVAQGQTAASVTNTSTAGNVQLGIGADQVSVENTKTNAQLQASLAQTAALEAIALAPYQVELAQLNSTAPHELTDLEHQVANLAALTGSALINVSGTVTTGNYPIQLAQSAGSDITQINAIATKYGTSGVTVAPVMNTQGYTARYATGNA